MRDIVSITGTIRTGLAALPTISSTQTPTVVNQGVVALAGYDGCEIYILTDALSSAGTMTPVIQYTNDDGTGNPNSGGWTNVPAADLVSWRATSLTDKTPVKLNDSNGNPTGNSQPNALTSSVGYNQRIGYIGGVAGTSDYLRVVSTVASSWSSTYDVVIVLGRPRVNPSSV